MKRLRIMTCIAFSLVLSSLGEVVLAQEPAVWVSGRARPGLAFRVIWFEREDPAQEASVTEFRFPFGAEYGSQVIQKANPIRRGADIKKDEHGNLVMSYSDPIEVPEDRPLMLGYVNDVVIYPDAHVKVKPDYLKSSGRIPESVKRDFLKDDDILTLTDPEIAKLAGELSRDARNKYEIVMRIWKFVYDNVKYSRVKRPNTAADVLEWKKGKCGEYGKLTISLLRACDIPARGVWSLRSGNTGPAFNDHAWAEAYLGGVGWLPVQPQEEPPTNHVFNLGYNSYFIVCRPASGMDPYRAVDWNNVEVSTGTRGAGFFADVPEGKRRETIELFQAIAEDDAGKKAKRHLQFAKKTHRSVEPMFYWLLCGSKNENVGLAAAQLLIEICSQVDRRLSLERFLAASPTLVSTRINQIQSQN